MKSIKVYEVEDLLNVGNDIERVEIDQDIVIKYIYSNKNNAESKINIGALRNAYAKSIKKSYAKKNYQESISFSSKDIKKIYNIEGLCGPESVEKSLRV